MEEKKCREAFESGFESGNTILTKVQINKTKTALIY